LREKGIEGLIHGNKGRPWPRRIPESVRDTINSLFFYKGEELPYRPVIPVEGERHTSPQMRALAVGV